jgi:hypothetical protein
LSTDEAHAEKQQYGVKMSTVLWVIQIILGIKLITVSYTHGLNQSKSTIQAAMQKMGNLSRPLLYTIAVCTFLGTMGLILPEVLKLSSQITVVTALILSLMLLISIFFHVKYREKPNVFVSVILAAFAAFVAYGRWVLVPL